MRVLIVGFDGLRPDCVTPERMPALAGFLRDGAHHSRVLSHFPTLTRVNKVSLATGAAPRCHGVVGNEFYDPAVFEDRFVDLGRKEDVDAVDERGGGLIQAPTMGAELNAMGRRLAVVHTGGVGAAWLLNYQCERNDNVVFSVGGPPYCHPRGLWEAAAARVGPLPADGLPNLGRLHHAVEVYLRHVEPEYRPDVGLIWLNEPDKTQHKTGFASDEAGAVFAGLNAIFARILDWWQAEGADDDVQLCVLSDHGHATRTGFLDLEGLMNGAGFAVTTDPARTGLLLAGGRVSGLYLRGANPDRLTPIVDWLQGKPWCGNIFAGDGGCEGAFPGTLSRELVGLAHPRSPDLLFCLGARSDGGTPDLPGQCYDAGVKPSPYGTAHGGLSQAEMHSVLGWGGSAFRLGNDSSAPCSIADVWPTIHHLMNHRARVGGTGRILHESLKCATVSGPNIGSTEHYAEQGAFRQSLRIAHVDGADYILGGKASNEPGCAFGELPDSTP